jgi:prophage tail gpP-like protein
MAIFTKLMIGGVEYDDDIDISMSSKIGNNNSAASFNIKFNNYTGRHATSFSVGDEVICYADEDINPPTTKVFNGVIEKIDYSGSGLKESLTISGRDFMSRLTDAMVEPETYRDTEVSLIVKDLIDKYVLGITVAGVTAPGGIFVAMGAGIGGNPTFNPTTKIVDHITFSSISVFDAIKFLAELSTSIFWVDNDKEIHFEPKSQSDSGFVVNNNNTTNANFSTSLNDVYNRIFVYGDRQQVRAPQETFPTDGGSVFTLQNKPHDTQVSYLGSIRTGGAYEFAENLRPGIEYYVDYDNKNLIFVSGTDAGGDYIPLSGGSVVVDYDKSVPLIKFTEDRTSVETYGPRTKWIVDKDINDGSYAKAKALTTLAELKNPKVQGKVKILGLPHITQGQFITVNIPHHNIINEQYDVVQIDYKFTKNNSQKGEVMTLTLNERDNDLVDTLKSVIQDVRSLQSGDVDADDLITRYEGVTGSVGVRTSGLIVRTRSIAGDALIWGNATFGIWGSGLWRDQANQSFVLGNPQAAVLGTSKLGTQTSAWEIVYSGGYPA